MMKARAGIGLATLFTMWAMNPIAAQERVEIEVGEYILETYVGEYEFAPGIALVVTLENGDVFAQLAGQGFIFDALISHQYLRHLGSWTIDFDSMTYYFPESGRSG